LQALARAIIHRHFTYRRVVFDSLRPGKQHTTPLIIKLPNTIPKA
jgi:hypothetical protein